MQCKLCGYRHDLNEAGYCEVCAQEVAQGYIVRSLAGRCSNGAERDHGTLFHAIRLENNTPTYRAICGAEPGKRSAGWSMYGIGKSVTCKRCLKKLDMKG